MKIPLRYFQKDDVVHLAKDLVGSYLFTNFDNELTCGMIVETEAYRGHEDMASHSNNGKKTKRNIAMFEKGGISYVYLCYGLHHLFNIVTNKKNHADAILIRAIKPISGIDIMLKRRNKGKIDQSIANGPALVSTALGININHNKIKLNGSKIWLEEKKENFEIVASPRVGVSYAKEDAFLPWRFRIKNCKYCSKAK